MSIKTISLPVRSCARCGEDHDSVEYREFQRPVIDPDGTTWGWWGTCPTSGDPILMKFDASGLVRLLNKYVKEDKPDDD